MGCDIHGYVEVQKYDFGNWYDCINIRSIVGRNYDMFALLFGVRNSASFIPVAPDRGLPPLVSDRTKEDFESWGANAHSASWISYQEITRINWSEQGTQLADRIFCYRPGEENWFSSFGWASWLTSEDYQRLNAGETIEHHDPVEKTTVLYRREVQNVSEALSKDWQCLFALMRCLDAYHRQQDSYQSGRIVESRALPALQEDTSKVRLVVWFDN